MPTTHNTQSHDGLGQGGFVHVGRLLRIPLDLLLLRLIGALPDIDLAMEDISRLMQDLGPVLEQGEGQTLALTVGDEIVALLGEEQIGLARGAEIAGAVAGVEEGGAVVAGHVGDGVGVGADGEALVVAVGAVVVVLDGPAAAEVEVVERRLGDGRVGHDLDLAAFAVAEEVLEEGADDGHHAGGEDDDGDLVLERPVVEGGEAGVEFDVLAEDGDGFGEAEAPAVDHGLEAVAEGGFAGEHVEVALAAFGVAEAVVVG